MDKYFCLYCVPDIFGNHEENCKLAEKTKTDEVLDDYGKILQDISELVGKDNKEEIEELIGKLKRNVKKD